MVTEFELDLRIDLDELPVLGDDLLVPRGGTLPTFVLVGMVPTTPRHGTPAIFHRRQVPASARSVLPHETHGNPQQTLLRTSRFKDGF
ncbi:hypothetical protein [Streptomyces massasporeus]|uniref:hypothetical protein n=1 Tax=Streptomyces massasporeus TaxID=67324 RepID=UPI0033E151C5